MPVLVALMALPACDTPARPTTTVRPVPTPVTLLQPEIRGLVRETDGGGIAGIRVNAVAANLPSLRFGITGPDGRFVIQVDPGTPVSYRVWSGGTSETGEVFLTAGSGTNAVPVDPPTPQSVELRLQRLLTVAVDRPVDTVLTDEGLAFEVADQYPALTCAPCKAIQIDRSDLGDVEIHVSVSPAVPLRVLLEGTKDYDGVLLDEARSDPGASSVTMAVSGAVLTSSQYDPMIYVERPRGMPPVSLRVELIKVQ